MNDTTHLNLKRIPKTEFFAHTLNEKKAYSSMKQNSLSQNLCKIVASHI